MFQHVCQISDAGFTSASLHGNNLGGEPPRVFKKARGSSPKNKTTNVSYVSHSARLDCCHRPDGKELDEEPSHD